MGIQRNTYKLVIIVLAIMTVACRPDDPKPQPARVDDDPKTFLMYDNIGDWFTADVVEAGRAVASGALADGHRVVVFHRRYSGNGGKPTIYELVRDRGASAGWSRKIIETIPQNQIALNATNLNNILGKMRAATPEANHFGLSFGSHGTGWIPSDNPMGLLRRRSTGAEQVGALSELWDVDGRKNTRYLAYNGAEKIDIEDFGAAVSGAISGETWSWDFIIFDDCFMASVEALYEIRHVADRFIASCTEILSYGFPYDRVVQAIFSPAGWDNTPAIGKVYIDYYKGLGGLNARATISVVNTAELEALATAVRAIRAAPAGYNDDVDPMEAGIQFFEGLSPHVFWDLEQYMYYFSRSLPLYDAFRAQLSRVVEWQGHTEEFYSALDYSGDYPVLHHSGLSVFIPSADAGVRGDVSVLIPDYEQTAWYNAVFND